MSQLTGMAKLLKQKKGSGIKSSKKESDRIQDSSIFAVTERIELAAAVKIILGDRSVKGMIIE